MGAWAAGNGQNGRENVNAPGTIVCIIRIKGLQLTFTVMAMIKICLVYAQLGSAFLIYMILLFILFFSLE